MGEVWALNPQFGAIENERTWKTLWPKNSPFLRVLEPMKCIKEGHTFSSSNIFIFFLLQVFSSHPVDCIIMYPCPDLYYSVLSLAAVVDAIQQYSFVGGHRDHHIVGRRPAPLTNSTL